VSDGPVTRSQLKNKMKTERQIRLETELRQAAHAGVRLPTRMSPPLCLQRMVAEGYWNRERHRWTEKGWAQITRVI
jgi:hypothetical protein